MAATECLGKFMYSLIGGQNVDGLAILVLPTVYRRSSVLAAHRVCGGDIAAFEIYKGGVFTSMGLPRRRLHVSHVMSTCTCHAYSVTALNACDA